ncbi:MAG: hypothetical protein RLZZ488_2681 [Pseudomonadota bacterium]|jgi:hypothetical protein
MSKQIPLAILTGLLFFGCEPPHKIVMKEFVIKNETDIELAVKYREKCGIDCNDAYTTVNLAAGEGKKITYEPLIVGTFATREDYSYVSPQLEFQDLSDVIICDYSFSLYRETPSSLSSPDYTVKKADECESGAKVFPSEPVVQPTPSLK